MATKILFQTALTDTETSDIEGIGSVREDQLGNKYRWVYNASTTAARVGGPACYDATLYSSNNFLKHALCAVADEDINFFAGVWMSAVPTLNYGWIMTWGRYSSTRIAVASGGSIAVGDSVVPSTYTTTTGTAAARCYAFVQNAVAAYTGSVAAAQAWMIPNCINPVAVATATGISSSTVPQLCTMFIRGL
jgi:hypothetical protein